MQRLGVPGTVRASFVLYNTLEEVDRLASALRAITEAASAGRKAAGRREAEVSGADFPGAVGESVEAAADELLDELADLGDWSERYQYLVELGQSLPPMPPGLKTETNRVHGCQSIVYLALRRRPATDDVVEFLADSNGEIVRGLIAVLQRLFSGRTAAEVCDHDLPAFLARAGLDTNLTTSRRNGLAEIIARVRGFAAGLCERTTALTPS